MDAFLVVFLVAILVVGVMVLVVISATRKSGKTLNREQYQSRWLVIENSLKRNESHSFELSILAADKLLDHALKQSGYRGQTMGERMKAANSDFSNANHVWSAHKIRNRIAHEPDVQLNYEIASRALQAYKQSLKDLGAI